MFKAVLLSFLLVYASASSLELRSGEINAHTEVFGDSSINPGTKDVNAKVSIENDITSIRGIVSIKSSSLVSDNLDRDKHMYKAINAKVNPKISYDIKSITKEDDGYTITGNLIFNNVAKEIKSHASIAKDDKNININGNFSIKLTDFGLEQPTLLFLTVRNQIDVKYNLIFNVN